MTPKTRPPVTTPVPSHHPAPPLPSRLRTPPTEPTEVLGRHKNDGQKGHKGAR